LSIKSNENRNPLPLTPFSREGNFVSGTFTYIGSGNLGGKASGLAQIKTKLDRAFADTPHENLVIGIPTLTVITTSHFDRFMTMNDLYNLVSGDSSDERIAHHFQKADLPPDLTGDLHALVARTHTPLAVRSSSQLEDSLDSPFAGIYATKMIPNNQSESSLRFQKLVEAIKFIYASTFFKSAREYSTSTGNRIEDEKMAVIIQDVVGFLHNKRYYPHLSGVARSYNFYPFGDASPSDGVVSLALGLGKTIVDGGVSWSYSPKFPQSPPPFNSIGDMIDNTQKNFWAVNMGKPPAYDPIRETEYLIQLGLEDAEYDNTLKLVASTYDPQSDRINIGTGSSGPRILNFAPLLEMDLIPLNSTVTRLMDLCESHFNSKVEIEFAMVLDSRSHQCSHFGLLQVRPIHVSQEIVDIDPDLTNADRCLAASSNALGNGINTDLADVVFVKPEKFEFKHSREIGHELEVINRSLVADGRPYLLVVFGRLGSSDHWLGIPVDWGAISGARAILEVTLTQQVIDLSQGSHFFHNISNLKVSYFSLNLAESSAVDWAWLGTQKTIDEKEFVRHVRLTSPLTIMVDGRKRTGVIMK
jgi:hypothetical protein